MIRMLASSFSRRLGAATLVCLSGLAQAADPQAVLERFSRDLQGLDGRFEQRVFDPDGRLDETSQGRVALQAPRHFRWAYEAPHPQLIVADGDHVWIYDPDLEQVQLRPQAAEEQHNPLGALIDRSERERQFQLAEGGQDGGLEWVELIPRSDNAAFARARLGFAGADLMRMEMHDALGQRTEIAFSGWRRNPVFADDVFRFTPPPGVDVIGERQPDALQVFPLSEPEPRR